MPPAFAYTKIAKIVDSHYDDFRCYDKLFILLTAEGQEADGFDMPWDNSVNKNAVIYAAHTTLGVRNMPLPG